MWTRISLTYSVFTTCKSFTESGLPGGSSRGLLGVLKVASRVQTPTKGCCFFSGPRATLLEEKGGCGAIQLHLCFFPPYEYPENHAIHESPGLLFPRGTDRDIETQRRTCLVNMLYPYQISEFSWL